MCVGREFQIGRFQADGNGAAENLIAYNSTVAAAVGIGTVIPAALAGGHVAALIARNQCDLADDGSGNGGKFECRHR